LINALPKAINIFFICIACFAFSIYASKQRRPKSIWSCKTNACLGCHAVNKKIVGPSFEAVAQKYQADSNAQVFLKNKIAKGGAGSWGVVPMP